LLFFCDYEPPNFVWVAVVELKGAGVLFVIESEYIVFKGLMRGFSILIVAPAGLRFVGKYESLEESALYAISC